MKQELYKNKNWLEERYTKEKMSFEKIAKTYGYGHTTIADWCKKLGIKSRVQPAKGVAIGSLNPAWKGGKWKTARGYIKVLTPEHPRNQNKYVDEHRLVMENKLKRYLSENEVVHHKNGIKDDNRIDNLMLFENEGKHKWYEIKLSNFCKRLLCGSTIEPEKQKELKNLFEKFLNEN